jgi:COX assembly protein 1
VVPNLLAAILQLQRQTTLHVGTYDTMSAASTPSGPQPIISNREEDTLRKQAKAKALTECRAQMEAFAQCTQTRTISMLWACRDQRNNLSDCLRV